MNPTPWRILAFVLVAGAVSILLAPRTRPGAAGRPWRIDPADTASERPPPEQPQAGDTRPRAPALH